MKDNIISTTTTAMTTKENQWQVLASNMARETYNPIRNTLETMDIMPHPDKPMISLSIGDPTTFGNLKPSQNIIDSITESLQTMKYNGYAPSAGYPECRDAVAKHVATETSPLTGDDVILCSGCSCSLDMCISALANPGQNILVPRPGFPLYKTLANGLGIFTREYNLMPERHWEVDVKHLESRIDENTVAIIINNPSNPCGSVFGEEHLLEILEIADRYKIPIIADEIYEHFVFEGSHRTYVPIASLTKTVPVLSCGGLTKRYLVPGWRLGWITVHDRQNLFKDGGVRKGLTSLSQRIIGANTIVQGALPNILLETPQSFFDKTLQTIEENAKIAFKLLSEIPGLQPVMPDGAMYMMVGMNPDHFPVFENCLGIVEGLVKEQSVFCLPGMCFNLKNYFRIVLTVPKDLLIEACHRIEEFCADHHPESRIERMALRQKAFEERALRFSAMSLGSTTSAASSSNSSDSDDESSDSPLASPTLPQKILGEAKPLAYKLASQDRQANPSRLA